MGFPERPRERYAEHSLRVPRGKVFEFLQALTIACTRRTNLMYDFESLDYIHHGIITGNMIHPSIHPSITLIVGALHEWFIDHIPRTMARMVWSLNEFDSNQTSFNE
jgi:uncharacterized membrane protein